MALASSACGQGDFQSAEGTIKPTASSQQVGATCTSNAQCSGANPICDTLISHKCQPCLTPVECLLKDGAAPWCVSGACVGCVNNSSCGGNTPICDNLLKMCVAGSCPALGADVDLLGLNLSVSTLPAHTGDTRVYVCLNDTIAVGATVTTCQANGTWSNPPPSCVPANSGCANDAACSTGQWCKFGSATTAGVCTAKVANGGSVPGDPNHVGVTLNGYCGEGVGQAVCVSGVCDSDNKCGYVNGDGTCQPLTSSAVCRSGVCGADSVCGHPNGEGSCSALNATTVCRSGNCSVAGDVCVPLGKCGTDLDCALVEWCNTESFTCTSKLPNASPVPTLPRHTPAFTGTCSTAVGASVCASGTCSTSDNSCGLPNGEGTCTILTAGICRSGVCDSVLGKCIAPPGCAGDLECDTTTQYCDTNVSACAPKVPNGGNIPTVVGHLPELTGACSPTVALAVCQSGVCDTDGKCGIKNGDGVCTVLTAGLVCRSGTCSNVAGVCIPSGGCDVDLDCAADQYCDTSVFACVDKKKNGDPIPTTPGHVPPLTGDCDVLTADSVCWSGVCDSSDDHCGYKTGNGPCTAANGSGVCRSGYCGGDGTCVDAPVCTVDANCDAQSYCATDRGVCAPKVPNGGTIPNVPGHSPDVNGSCTDAAAASVCLSGVCDTIDNTCGYHDDRGPCDASTAATVCRSGICAVDSGLCVECNDDSQCSGTASACDTVSHTCEQCTVKADAACAGASPICDVTVEICVSCGGDFGSRALNACNSTAAPYCFSNGSAKAGQCGKCSTSADCAGHPTGDVCDTGTGACLPGCGSDSDCFTGWTCSVDHACVPPTGDDGEPVATPDPTSYGGMLNPEDAGLVPAGGGCSATGTDGSLAALVMVLGLVRIASRKRK